MNKRIVVVEDELAIRIGIQHSLSAAGYDVAVFEDGNSALAHLQVDNSFSLLITDYRLPNISGMELLTQVHELYPHMGSILITAFPEVELAVEAMRLGSFDFLCKPFSQEVLLIAIERFYNFRHLSIENQRLKDGNGLEDMVGGDAMKEVFNRIRAVADSCVPVLVQGASGTGKELVANAVHSLSSRKNKPFIKVNCAALPEHLLESELFGHERGAFTGADSRRIGKFEAAHGGTFFFDEMGDMPLNLQAKLLRVLEDGEITRVGGNEPIQVDVRTIFATARNIEEAVQAGEFREDLSYRINVVPVHLPDLAARGDDIVSLMKHFLLLAAKKYGKENIVLSEPAFEALRNYSYPGNIRELRNIFERSVLLAEDSVIRLAHLPQRLRVQFDDASGGLESLTLEEGVRHYEKRRIIAALENCSGKRQQAADTLGISRKVLWKKMKDFDIEA